MIDHNNVKWRQVKSEMKWMKHQGIKHCSWIENHCLFLWLAHDLHKKPLTDCSNWVAVDLTCSSHVCSKCYARCIAISYAIFTYQTMCYSGLVLWTHNLKNILIEILQFGTHFPCDIKMNWSDFGGQKSNVMTTVKSYQFHAGECNISRLEGIYKSWSWMFVNKRLPN